MTPNSPARLGHLTRGQLLLSVAIGLMVLCVGALIIESYLNVSATSEAFEMGYLLADLARVQRAVGRLHLETMENLRSRSVDMAQAEVQRALLENQIRLTLAQAQKHPRVSDELSALREILAEYDALLGPLSRQPRPGDLAAAEPRFADVLARLEVQVQRINDQEQSAFFTTIASALESQRRTQVILLVLIFLLLGFGVALALSVRSRVNRQFQSAYERLQGVVAERTRAQEELRAQNEYLSALHETSVGLMNHLELDELLQAILTRAVALVQGSDGFICLAEEEGQELTMRYATGRFVAALGRHLQRGEGLSGRVWQSGEPLAVADYRRWEGCLPWASELDIHAIVGVPLRDGDRVIGVLGVGDSGEGACAFGTERIDLLSRFAHLASVALDNARLYTQARKAAALEERQRLARELHDAVTQTLFSASLIAEVLPRVWERNQEMGRQRLADLHQLTRGALAEMRALLMELRPAALMEAPLRDLLQGLADATRGRARVPVEVACDGDGDLPPAVKVALYRIAQEALNNVVKHAAAERVSIALRLADGQARLTVRDDGCGFEPGGASPESLGLAIMGERAAEVGARVRIETAPGQGTLVAVTWPADQDAEDEGADAKHAEGDTVGTV